LVPSNQQPLHHQTISETADNKKNIVNWKSFVVNKISNLETEIDHGKVLNSLTTTKRVKEGHSATQYCFT